jgi:hypothetical protein
MASYYLSFKCDMCEEFAVKAIFGISTNRQEEILSPTATHGAVCDNGHYSTYFQSQIVKIHRKLTLIERQTQRDLLGDERFVDI